MITLGMLIGALIKGNPTIAVVASKKIEAGMATEVTSIKIAERDDGEKTQIIILTI